LLAQEAADTSRSEDSRLHVLTALRCFHSRRVSDALDDVQSCLSDPSEPIRVGAQATLEAWGDCRDG
jgi:hypothetical protein